MGDNIKIVKSLKVSVLLIKGVTQTVKNEVKEQKGGFPSMLLGTLGASLLGNHLTGREVIPTSQGRRIYRAGKGKGINRAREGVLRAGCRNNNNYNNNNKMDF